MNSISYEKSSEYWADIPATVDGVLGGLGFISQADVEGSKLFLESLISSKNLDTNRALDCGAGIGRITKHVLIPYFNNIDVIEPDEKFLNSIKGFVGSDATKIDSLYQVGLQDFYPEHKYDVIWNQWVLNYLKDEDLVLYLEHCRDALTPNGVIVVKENVTSSGNMEEDEIDSSVTRSLKQFLQIFKKAKLKRIRQCKQTNFPNGLYPVYMFALIPDESCVKINENQVDTTYEKETNEENNQEDTKYTNVLPDEPCVKIKDNQVETTNEKEFKQKDTKYTNVVEENLKNIDLNS